MITALAIAALLLTALIALTLPLNGWGSGIDAAGRGMAMFFPAIFMAIRAGCLAIAFVILAADGGLAWTGLPPLAAGAIALVVLAATGGLSFYAAVRLTQGSRSEHLGAPAFLASIVLPCMLCVLLLAESYGAPDAGQIWLVRAMVAVLAVAPIPLVLRSDRIRRDAQAVHRSSETAEDAAADARVARLSKTASLNDILAFADRLDEADWRARQRVMAQALAYPAVSDAMLNLLGSPDRETRLRAAIHSVHIAVPTTMQYFEYARPEIETIVARLKTRAAPAGVLYREALAAIRLAWPAINSTSLPKSLMVDLYEAIDGYGEEAGFPGLLHDAGLLKDYVAA